MKRTLSFILAIAMVVSFSTCFSLNTTAEETYVPADGTMKNIEVAKVTTAPTMDGQVDDSYTKIFDISGADTWYLKPDGENGLVWARDNHATVDYNSETRRYDAETNPDRTSSEWYNSRLEGYAAWDATNLYLCVVITTPHKINDNAASTTSWTGDDIEIAAYNPSKSAATKFVMSQVAGALQVYPSDVAGLGIAKGKTYDTTGLVNKTSTLPGGGFYKTETGYVYELTLGWKTGFGITAASNLSVPFNVAVNFNNAAADAATSCGIQAGAGIYNEGGKVNLMSQSGNQYIGFALKLVDALTCAHANTEWVVNKEYSETEGSGEARRVCKDCGEIIATKYLNEPSTPAAEPAAEVVDNITAIINYLGDTASDVVAESKGLTALLTERLAAYKAKATDENLVSLIKALETWSTGGYDASKVFFTDKLFSHIKAIIDYVAANNVVDASGSLVFETPNYWAKRTTAQLKDHILAVGTDLYVAGKAPADFTADIDTAMAAIEAADTAAVAATTFTGLIDTLNEKCMLASAQKLYDLLAEAKELEKDTSGDAGKLATLQEYIPMVEEMLAENDQFGMKSYPNAGFVQYRPAGQADSFVEDVASYNNSFEGLYTDFEPAVSDYKATIKAEDPYEVKIKEQVISATQAIINYLDNTAATDVLENKTITTLLTERLAAYTAAPSADTLNAIVAAWDAWTYGGQDADKVFFTDYFKTLIAAFPTKENGEVYIEAGAAKKSPRDIVQKYMVRVDDTLYVNNYGPSADYDSGAEDSIKVIGRNAMNAATTSSAAYAALQAAIAHLNASCKLISYANLEAKLAEAKAVKAGGDAEAKANLDYAIGEAEKLMDAHKAVGFWQYRPAGQADSFTEDVAESDAAYKSMISDLTDLINAYNATIVEYEVKIKEQVISATQAIINYLDNTAATDVLENKTITTLLTERLAAYTAAPSADTLNAIVAAWDAWTYGGQDADKVFFTDYFKTLIAAFPTKENGEVYIEAGAAKKSPRDIVQKYMVRVDDTLYVNNYGPSADYDSGAEDSIKVIGRNAMNAATTSSAAYAALQAAIAHLNASCKLISYANLEAKLAEAKAVKAGGDAEAKANLDYAIGEAEKLMDAHKAVGFWQYRPAGQADSFTEDVAESDAAYKSMISDLTDLINAYNATIPTGPSGLTFEENGDIRYYEDGVAVVKGLVKDTDGSYYFINSTKKAVKNTWYAFNEAFANGLLPAGRYYFGEDGKLQQLNGVVVEANGDVRYYENGVAVAKGLVKDDAGNYYFINGTKKAVKNTFYAFNDTFANGLLPAGRYFFGEDGKLQQLNGVVVESNGDIRYYENNVAVAKGLVEYEGNYYFINSSLKAVKNTYYAFNAKYANGLLPAGRYFFDAEGKLVQQ